MENQVWQNKIDQATVLSELARTCWAASDYAKAQEYLLQALAILEEEFGPDHIPLVRVLHSLGLLARVRVHYEESENYYIRALKICEKLLGAEALGTATRMNYLAGLYNAQADYSQAEVLLQRSLAIYRSKLGEVNQQVALILMALAILNKRLGKDKEAKSYREQMYAVNAQLSKADDVKVALSKLADFFYSQDRLDDADLVFRYGLILGEEQEFPQHPFVAESLLGLARLYADYEAWQESLALYQRAIVCWEKLSGPSGVELRTSLIECAKIMRKLDMPVEADKLEKKAEKLSSV